MMVYLWLFRAAATTHLVFAVLFMFTDPNTHWNHFSPPLSPPALHAAREAPALFPAVPAQLVHAGAVPGSAPHWQLVAADRQVATGFLAIAFLARRCDPEARSGVRTACVILLWNLAMFFNGSSFIRLFSKDHALDRIPLGLQEVFLIGHTLAAALVAAVYLAHFYTHQAAKTVAGWAHVVQERHRGALSWRPGRARVVPLVTEGAEPQHTAGVVGGGVPSSAHSRPSAPFYADVTASAQAFSTSPTLNMTGEDVEEGVPLLEVFRPGSSGEPSFMSRARGEQASYRSNVLGAIKEE